MELNTLTSQYSRPLTHRLIEVFRWLSRNFSLLISGLVLLPLSFYALLVSIGFGYGFTDGESIFSLLFIWLISFYVIVFGVSIKLSIRSYKKYGDYKYWDFMPMVYFFSVFFSMFWGSFSVKNS